MPSSGISIPRPRAFVTFVYKARALARLSYRGTDLDQIEAILNVWTGQKLNSRRVGKPRRQARGSMTRVIWILNRVGLDAGEMVATWGGREVKLLDAYEHFVCSVLASLRSGEVGDFEAFVFPDRQSRAP